MAHTKLPEAGLDYLIGGDHRTILVIGDAPALVNAIAKRNHRVMLISKDASQLTRFADNPLVVSAVATPESLPFHPCQFDAVIAHQNFHTFAPGLVLSEVARVLRPGGHIAISYLVRDDSVPWVQKLAGLVQQVNPEAMRAFHELDSVNAMLDSKYFPSSESKSFRLWIEASRKQLLDMTRGATPSADEDERNLLLEAVGELYDQYATGIRNLRLPYSLRIWRGFVDHAELTAPIEMADSGLIIPV